MQISLKFIRLINHAKKTVCIKQQLLTVAKIRPKNPSYCKGSDSLIALSTSPGNLPTLPALLYLSMNYSKEKTIGTYTYMCTARTKRLDSICNDTDNCSNL